MNSYSLSLVFSVLFVPTLPPIFLCAHWPVFDENIPVDVCVPIGLHFKVLEEQFSV